MSVVYQIKSASWWKAATWRAIRTAISVFVPILAATSILEVDWAVAGSTLGLAVVASYLTSLAGLKELTEDTVPKWVALGVRAIKQFAQTAVGYIGAALLITDVDWQALLTLSVGASVMTILQGLLTVLPEADETPVAEIETSEDDVLADLDDEPEATEIDTVDADSEDSEVEPDTDEADSVADSEYEPKHGEFTNDAKL